MINPENQLDEHFQDKLEDLEITPPERVWAGIANNLDRAEINSQKRRFAWLWWMSAVSLIVSISALAAIYFKGNDQVALGQSSSPAIEKTSLQAKEVQQTPGPNTTNTAPVANGDHTSIAEGNSSGSSSYSSSRSSSSSASTTSISTANQTLSNTVTSSNATTTVTASLSAANDTKEQEHVYTRTAIRHVDLQKEKSNELVLEKQYKIIVLPPDEEMAITAPAIRLIPEEQRTLAGIFAPLEDIDPVPGRVICPKWKAGIHYTYAWNSFRHLEDGDSLGFYEGTNRYLPKYRLTSAHYDSIEYKRTGFSKGFALGYRVLPHFTLRTGVDITRYQWDASIADAVLVKDPDKTFTVVTCASTYNTDSINGMAAENQFSITGFTPVPQDADTLTITHTFNYISIPLSVSYNILQPCSKFGLSVNAGVAASFLKNYTITQNGIAKEHKSEYIRSRSMELIAGATVNYDPCRNVSIELQPVYRRFIQPVNKYQSVKTYPYMWGLQGGVYFKF